MNPPSLPRRPVARALCFVLLCAVCLLCLRLNFVHTHGSDVPYMDQWVAQGVILHIADGEGTLEALNFRWPHNEHHVLWTRLSNYALARLNRQWDPLLEMSFNALLQVSLLGALLLRVSRSLHPLVLVGAGLFWVGLFSLPIAWENSLQGFQSQFYFAELSAVAALWFGLGARPLGGAWLLGLGFGLAGCGAMAGGFLVPLLLGCLSGLTWVLERRWPKGRELAAFLLLLAAAWLGTYAIHPVPHHATLKALSLAQGLEAFLRLLAWPFPEHYMGGFLLVQAPALLWLLRQGLRLRRKGSGATLEGESFFFFGLVAWVWLQAAAIAYGRANSGSVLSSRYLDLCLLGLFAQGCLGLLQLQTLQGSLRRLLVLAGLGCVAVGVGFQVEPHWSRHSSAWAAQKLEERLGLNDFLRLGNPGSLTRLDQVPGPDGERPGLSYPKASELAAWLQHPALRRLLPVSLHAPVPLEQVQGTFARSQRVDQAPSGRLFESPIWTGTGPGRFESQFFSCPDFAVLRLRFSAQAGLPSDSLRLEDASGGRYPLQVKSFRTGSWQSAHLPLPARGTLVRLVFDLPAGFGPCSFEAPRPLGHLSWWAYQLRKGARGALPYATALLLFCTLSLALASRVRPWWR